jgi:hypothetical protein
VSLCAPQRIRQFSHEGDESKYITEYNVLPNLPSRFNEYTGLRSLREDPLWGGNAAYMSISLNNAIVLDRLAARIDAGAPASLRASWPGLSHGCVHVVRRIEGS